MSTAGDIWDVYQAEIVSKSGLVYRKGGASPFFDGVDIRVQSLFQVPDLGDMGEGELEEEIDAEGDGRGPKERGQEAV